MILGTNAHLSSGTNSLICTAPTIEQYAEERDQAAIKAEAERDTAISNYGEVAARESFLLAALEYEVAAMRLSLHNIHALNTRQRIAGIREAIEIESEIDSALSTDAGRALLDERERRREALNPFACAAIGYPETITDGSPCTVTIGDCRRAREVLKP